MQLHTLRNALLLAPLLAAGLDAQARLSSNPLRTRPRTAAPPNVLLIVADDLGVDLVGAYGEGIAPACTPNIDRLASDGMLFRNAWANPTCSPTRAALLTGRFGFRTGIGTPASSLGLDTSELTLPRLLNGFESRCVGKWHLAGNAGPWHPNDCGFDSYAGGLGGGLPSYSSWSKTVNGSTSNSTTYATRDTATDALAAIGEMQAPWFLQVAFNAPHTPHHRPPTPLCGAAACTQTYCGNLAPGASAWQEVNAMVEVMDRQIGRILSAVDAAHPNTLVIFLGDNGTAGMASQAPFLSSHAKGSVYEGGVNVPLIVRGPGVLSAETGALVSVVDLHATLADLCGSTSSAEDSVSFADVLANPAHSARRTVYSESFTPNGPGPYSDHDRAVRNERFKLIRRLGEPDELYDLSSDPFETSSLLPDLSASQQVAYDELLAALVALGVE